MCQISRLMVATEGPVAEFSSFANFEESKRKCNLLMSFPKIVHLKGSFGQTRKNPLFRFCRPILDIFGLTLLTLRVTLKWSSISSRGEQKFPSCFMQTGISSGLLGPLAHTQTFTITGMVQIQNVNYD